LTAFLTDRKIDARQDANRIKKALKERISLACGYSPQLCSLIREIKRPIEKHQEYIF
jgi:hypothetical protein